MRRFFPVILFAASILSACENKSKLTPEELQAYQNEIDTWHAGRIEKVKAPNGWLNLVGLHWLQPGINTFGSGKDNQVVFPEGIAEKAGYFFVKGNQVEIIVNDGVVITANGQPVKNQVIFHADSARPVLLESGTLRWNIIKRDTELGVRLRDLESETLRSFTGVERFPVDPAYRVEATFEKADSLRTINITNVLGQTNAQRSPGTLVFSLQGNEYRLEALEGGAEEYFIILADETSGDETYGGGRFLYVKHEDANGKIALDFNKAYNPPCVFTPYATCPLPPQQNVLPLEIRAGEKNYGHAEAKEIVAVSK